MFCGIDWASDHHDVALVDDTGSLLAKARVDNNADGLAQLLHMLAEHSDTADAPIPVAIETCRGLLVACLRATGRPIYAINPMAAARYRDRHAVSRKKSDHLDSMVLANILRTDAAAPRRLPADSELAQAIAVLARAQQDAVWDRTQAANKLTSHLREYFPGFLAAVGVRREGVSHPIARVVLAAAPTPAQAARLTRTQLRSLLKKAGHRNTIDAEAERLQTAPRRCVNFRWSKRPWAVRPSRCCGNSTPPAAVPTTSPRPRQSLLRNTRTPRSSPASQGSARSAAPGGSPRSATTDPVSLTPRA